MRTILSIVLLAVLTVGRPLPVRAEMQVQAEEAGLALGAMGLTVFYLPIKVTIAAVGLAVGSVAGLLSGGDVRSAYALWVPAASGTYLLTPAHLDGSAEVELFGSDYADRPSTMGGTAQANAIYEGSYGSR
jgi:hypothetical protein